MPDRPEAAKVASKGVTRTRLYVEEELDWIFREQPTEDYGIDAHVEVVDGSQVRGRLLALQIKSGSSWFREPANEGWWYRPSNNHVTYWLNHSLPVVVVLYNPDTRLCHWQSVTRRLLEKTGEGWKILVPERNRLDSGAADVWRGAADGDPYELRLRELRIAKPWMDMLSTGTRLTVEFDEWVNKSSGRGSVTIGVDHEDGGPPHAIATWAFIVGPRSYRDDVPDLFAWAQFTLHEETYDDSDNDLYAEECMIRSDGEDFYTEDYMTWHQNRFQDGIRPYSNSAGEVDHFRLELCLNDLARAFLIVDDFATNGKTQLID